ncbi:MAG: PfkB family carbohydrate kinase [Sphaerochaeta sp.]
MPRILALGDNVVDRFLDRAIMYPGGQAMNVSVYAHMLGVDSAYMGVFGNDENAELNINILKKFGIDFSRCRILNGKNAVAYVKTDNGERIFIESNKGGVARNYNWDFTEGDLSYIANFNLIHTDQNSYIENELSKLYDYGVKVSYDFSENLNEEYLKMCAPYCYIAFISTGNHSEDYVLELMRDISQYNPVIVVATRGILGSVALFQEQYFYQESFPVQVKDTMGAGDSFAAGFLVSLLKSSRFSSDSVKVALYDGAKMAARICGLEGSYGHGRPFVLTQMENSKLIESKNTNTRGYL